jgi:hypothetical protein
MATTDLKLDEPGTLPRPGPIGRLARLLFGALCLYYVYALVAVSGSMLSSEGSIRPLLWNGIIPGLFLVSYVINIGFSRAWKKWPAVVSAVSLGAIALAGHLTTESAETAALARSIWSWELYVFGHLGTAFLFAAIIGTPGCEMRAFHDLYSQLTGVPTKEHYCPVGPLHPIDQWEVGRTS